MGGYNMEILLAKQLLIFDQWINTHQDRLFQAAHPFIVFEQTWPDILKIK